ncbi:MAG: hypothetical protein HY064_03640 [Bacteroidetes bacterium]|nr:hypothetical protein [Bacteroidota bacterium]
MTGIFLCRFADLFFLFLVLFSFFFPVEWPIRSNPERYKETDDRGEKTENKFHTMSDLGTQECNTERHQKYEDENGDGDNFAFHNSCFIIFKFIIRIINQL